jgi:hypothetical protein
MCAFFADQEDLVAEMIVQCQSSGPRLAQSGHQTPSRECLLLTASDLTPEFMFRRDQSLERNAPLGFTAERRICLRLS